MEAFSRSFSIKNGQFHIFPDHLEIEDGGLQGWSYQILTRMGIRRALVLNFLMILAFVGALIISLAIANYMLAFFFGIMALYYGFLLWKNRNLSLLPNIPRDQVEGIDFFDAVPGERRAFFVVRFSDGKGRKLYRPIKLPTERQRAEMLAQSAYQILREENLISG